MVPLASAGAGFLLAVLWFDLMFDVQVLRRGGEELPEEVLASIAAYYARVTTAARPMSRLIAAVMLVTLGALVAQVVDDEVAPAGLSLVLAAVPIALAGSRTLPAAVRLGARAVSARGTERARAADLSRARRVLRLHRGAAECPARRGLSAGLPQWRRLPP